MKHGYTPSKDLPGEKSNLERSSGTKAERVDRLSSKEGSSGPEKRSSKHRGKTNPKFSPLSAEQVPRDCRADRIRGTISVAGTDHSIAAEQENRRGSIIKRGPYAKSERE